MLDKIAFNFSRYGLVINAEKTKVMFQRSFSGKPSEPFEIKIGLSVLKQVDSFCYLGGNFEVQFRHKVDMSRRIGKCRATFDSLRKGLWYRREISLDTKCMIYAALILSCLLYGCEVWELTAVDLQKLEAFHIGLSRF